jgi:Family of unknown function (DUF5957)
MRTVVLAALGAVGGFLAGLVLSEVVGVIGYVASGDAVGIKYLSLFLAVAGAIIVPVIAARRRRSRTAQPSGPKRHR